MDFKHDTSSMETSRLARHIGATQLGDNPDFSKLDLRCRYRAT